MDSKTLKGFKNALTSFPEAKDEEESALDFLEEDILRADIEDGEPVFNSLFVYPFVKAVPDIIAADIDNSLADFRPGEVILESMSNQLKISEIFKNDKWNY
ncbi:hypothetical protein [Parasitella parasitica]|uniref:Uncharacterized protein n=1 Tax=Parasitella parasitica TaxID=35722 RepID=A0A0B7N1B9_9FUNG|nr:hypothetical protein [Parasitella parasitica]